MDDTYGRINDILGKKSNPNTNTKSNRPNEKQNRSEVYEETEISLPTKTSDQPDLMRLESETTVETQQSETESETGSTVTESVTAFSGLKRNNRRQRKYNLF